MKIAPLSLSLVLLLPASSSGQAVLQIPDQASCETCSIQFTRVATLGGETDAEGLVHPESRVVQDSKGNYYLGPTYTRGIVVKYAPSGRPIDILGHPGGGPGEHESIVELAVSIHDSLYVLDADLGRFSVWGPDGAFHRVGRLPGYPYEVRVLPDGRLVLQAWLSAPETAGYPIQVLDENGSITALTGSDSGDFLTRNAIYKFRAIAIESDSTVWSGRYNTYEIELWSLRGQLLRTMRRSAPWFEPWEQQTAPPKPTLRALAADSVGRLWILITAADPDWTVESDRDAPLSAARAHRMFDTVIEIIDARTGELLVSGRHDKLIERFIAPGRVPIFEEDESGSLRMGVWQMRVRK